MGADYWAIVFEGFADVLFPMQFTRGLPRSPSHVVLVSALLSFFVWSVAFSFSPEALFAGFCVVFSPFSVMTSWVFSSALSFRQFWQVCFKGRYAVFRGETYLSDRHCFLFSFVQFRWHFRAAWFFQSPNAFPRLRNSPLLIDCKMSCGDYLIARNPHRRGFCWAWC